MGKALPKKSSAEISHEVKWSMAKKLPVASKTDVVRQLRAWWVAH
jgi:hypothetical protein